MQRHCAIGFLVAKPRDTKTIQFSVTLPKRAAEMLEELADVGLHGSTRGEVARTIITARLEEMIGKNLVDFRKSKAGEND
jgi:sulfite reductase beta subunit-like hemoprotein